MILPSYRVSTINYVWPFLPQRSPLPLCRRMSLDQVRRVEFYTHTPSALLSHACKCFASTLTCGPLSSV